MRQDLVLAAVLAPVAGSFLSTLVTRAPDLRSALVGRSRCDACGATPGAVDLVPILGWVALRGRCRQCGARIDPAHPAMEFGCLALALWAGTVFSGPALGLACLFGWLLLTLGLIDLRTGLLPDPLVLALAAGGIGQAILVPDSLGDRLAGAALGGGTLALVAFAYARLRGREGLGQGDVKLVAALGLWVGLEGLPATILGASLAGLAIAGVRALAGRAPGRDEEMPFGPCLAAAGWLAFLYAAGTP